MNIQRALHDFCKQINGSSPVSIPFQPEPWAKTNYCFANVNRKIEECGGDGQLGWQFVQMTVGTTPGVLIAIHHEVWTSVLGTQIDITPCVKKTLRSESGVYFLPDAAATLVKPIGYEVGISRPSKFFPLTRTAKVRKMAEALRLNERRSWEEASTPMA